MLAGSIPRCNVSLCARIFLSFTGIRKFLRTYSRHRISNSDPFREQGTNTPLVIGRETGHLDDLLAKYSIQTQQSLEPSTYAELLTTAYLMVEEIRTSTLQPRTYTKRLAGDSLFNGARDPNFCPATTHVRQTPRWQQPF